MMNRIYNPTFLAVSAFLLVLLAASIVSAEPQESPYSLSAGEVLTRNMGRNQRHVYSLSLMPKQFARVTVDQKGLDVVVKLLDPNRLLLVERDSPNGKFGPEAVSIVAQLEGVYYIEVYADKSQPAATYELRVDGPRESIVADNSHAAAERIPMEAQRLAGERTTESRNLA